MEYVLKTKDLKKTYGNYNALNGLSMNVPKGSIYGLIGRNGVGKTTLIRLICGLQKATEGDFSLWRIKTMMNDYGCGKGGLDNSGYKEIRPIYGNK